MKRLLVATVVVSLVLTTLLSACTGEPKEILEPSDERGEFYWYGPNYPDMMGPELGEDLSYFDWGSLLPEEPEVLIAEGDGWAAYKRGNFDSGSILFPLADRGIHDPGWSDRLVEVFPNEAIEIVPEEMLPPFIMEGRKYEDGTYSFSAYGKGIWHIDADGKTLHRYLDKDNGHESLILPNGRVLSYSFESGIARITDWEGNIFWEWDQDKEIVPFNLENYPNLEFHYGTRFEDDGTLVPHVYDPIQLVKDNQEDGGVGLNRVQVLENGHKLLSLRNLDLVIEVDEYNNTVWSFGPTVLKHQHSPTLLPNGNILIHDTGNNRAIEVTRDHKIVWEFRSGMVSPYMGMVQRLPDGTTLISDGLRTSVTAVNQKGEVLWEVYIKGKDTLTRTEALEFVPKVLPGFRIYRAWWYPDGGGEPVDSGHSG